MALEPVNSGFMPISVDGYDTLTSSLKGGEVATIIGFPIGADNAAADADGSDGYVGANRPVATTALTSGDRPLFLVDDGKAGYGTLFGVVVGEVVGQTSYGPGEGTNLGPSTAAGSGKWTLWDKPGTYAVTLDAVDTGANGLVPSNGSLAIGDAIYATTAGLLTTSAGSVFENVALGHFINFEAYKGGSLVTTPVSLVSAANSPAGQGQPQHRSFKRALISWNPPV